MQDRIKQMAEEAGFCIDPDCGAILDTAGNYIVEDAVRLLVMAVAEDLVAVVREHDREGYALHMLQEHILARYGIKE